MKAGLNVVLIYSSSVRADESEISAAGDCHGSGFRGFFVGPKGIYGRDKAVGAYGDEGKTPRVHGGSTHVGGYHVVPITFADLNVEAGGGKLGGVSVTMYVVQYDL